MFKQILPLASIMFIRFFGMFIVMPILSLYALGLEGATPFLVGLVFASYALIQVLLVVPFGILSDKIGRKKTIGIGLAIFAVGSLVSALSGDIYWLIIGRLLQGAGAINAVTSALISDIIKEEQRTKAMAVVGMSIGMSTIISMILGPLIAGYYDVSILFYLTFVLVLVEIVVLFAFVENPPVVHYTFKQKSTFRDIFANRSIMLISWINFFQKGLITLTFVIVPILFTQMLGWDKSELIWVYLPAFVIAFLAMGFGAALADGKGKYKEITLLSIALFTLSYIVFAFATTSALGLTATILFFVGFNMLEPMMQSLVTKYAKSHERGLGLGIFNAFGFLGSAIGGVVGGVAITDGWMDDVGFGVALVSILTAVFVLKMHNPARLKNLYLDDTAIHEENLDTLQKEGKIVEWYRNDNEKLAIVKFDNHHISEEELRQIASK